MVGSGQAASKTGALIMGFQGRVQTESAQPVRTLQALAPGSRLVVGSGAKLSLTYLVNGRKETVSGPCSVEIGSVESRLLTGSGRLEGVEQSGSETLGPHDDKLKKLGGALQASVDLEPEALVALVGQHDLGHGVPEVQPQGEPIGSGGGGEPHAPVPSPDPRPAITVAAVRKSPGSGGGDGVPIVEGATKGSTTPVRRPDSQLVVSMELPPVLLSPEDLEGALWWVDRTPEQLVDGMWLNRGPFPSWWDVALEDEDRELYRGRVELDPRLLLEGLDVGPGKRYRLTVLRNDLQELGAAFDFYILTPTERKVIETEARRLRSRAEAGEKEAWSELIWYFEERGLVREALHASEMALEGSPEDPGFRLARARAAYNLGREFDAFEQLLWLAPTSGPTQEQ